MIGNNLAISIDDKLGKIPRYLLGLSLVSICKAAIQTEIAVDWVRVGSVYLNLREHWELCAIFTLSELLDLCLSPGLLTHELITGECKDFKPSFTMLLMKLDQLFVVLVSQTSLRRHIDDHHALLVGDQAAQLSLLTIDVTGSKLMQAFRRTSHLIDAILGNCFEYKPTH